MALFLRKSPVSLLPEPAPRSPFSARSRAPLEVSVAGGQRTFVSVRFLNKGSHVSLFLASPGSHCNKKKGGFCFEEDGVWESPGLLSCSGTARGDAFRSAPWVAACFTLPRLHVVANGVCVRGEGTSVVAARRVSRLFRKSLPTKRTHTQTHPFW